MTDRSPPERTAPVLPQIPPIPPIAGAAGRTLGVVVITRDAQAHLANCLNAVDFADDRVVLDSGSVDRTVEIARACGARIFTTSDWPGFGPQKNRAIALLDTDWILVLDADEIVTPELAESIRRVVAQGGESGGERVAATPLSGPIFSLDRISCFCGRWIQHSGWRPDPVPRLFQRGAAHFSADQVHERLVFSGPAPVLDGALRHYSYDDIATVIRKVDQYAAAGARQRFAAAGAENTPGRTAATTVRKAVLRGAWAFFRTFVLKRGFLDGGAGWMIAAMNAQTVYYRFLRLRELELRDRVERSLAEQTPTHDAPTVPPVANSGRDKRETP